MLPPCFDKIFREITESEHSSIEFQHLSIKSRQIIDVKFEIHSRKNSVQVSVGLKINQSNMERDEFNVVVIDDELKDRSIVGDEYGFFNLNQIPLTGLILILLTGQIFNIILNKILDSILKTIIYLREVNPSRQGSRQDFNRYHLIIKIIIKIIIFVIDII